MEQNFTHPFKRLLKTLLLLLMFVAGLTTQAFAQSSLPLNYAGPWDSGSLPAGWSAESFWGPWAEDIGPSTEEGGSFSFDVPEDYLIVQYDGTASEVSYWLAHQFVTETGTGYTGGFNVSESADGINFTTLLNHANIPAYNTEAEETGYGAAKYMVNPAPATRYLKFEYTANDGLSIMLDALSATAPSADADINVKQETTNIASGGNFNFENTTVGGTNPKIFTIENLGSIDLQLTGTPYVILSGAHADQFSVEQPSAGAVTANGNTTFNVTFSPTSFGDKSAVISISSNDPDEPTYTINLAGTADIAPPVITSLSPIKAGAGEKVTITGTGFSNVTSVRVNGASVTPTTITDTQIDLIVPAAAPNGSGTIRVESAAGFDEEAFTVATVRITNISPSLGTIGDVVTITGENFPSSPSVRFYGSTTNATLSTRSSATQIKVFVPTSAKTGPISIIVNSNYTAQSGTFTVTGPTISSFNPSSAKVGAVVTITGTGYTQTSTVTFAGANSTTVNANVIFDSKTQLRATVPAGAVTGLISVTTEGRTGQSATNFVVLTPTITVTGALTPFTAMLNTASASQSYQVSGENLDADITVAAPSNFEVSLDDITYTNTVAITALNGAVASTGVYVRYLPTTRGSHSGNISVSSTNATTKTITVQGSTLDPTITANGSFTEFTTQVGAPSAPQSYTVGGTNLEGGIIVTAPERFQVSLFPEGDTRYGSSVALPLENGSTSIAPTTVYVRYNPDATGIHGGNVSNTSLNAADVLLAVNGSSNSVLPVELISFKAEQKANEVTLVWATASEKDNSHFEVEMSANPEAGFARIGKVKSKAGNSAVTTNYLLKYSLTEAGTHYFRLKQVDLDGTFAYSKVVAVEAEFAAIAENRVYVAPNPLNYNSKAFVVANTAGKANLVLHSMAGKQMYQKTVEVNKGRNEIQLPLYDKLPAGLYILTVELEGQRHQLKVVKQ